MNWNSWASPYGDGRPQCSGRQPLLCLQHSLHGLGDVGFLEMRILMRLGIPGQSAGESVDNLLMDGRFEEIFHLIRVLLQIEEPRLAASGINQFIAVGHRAEPAFGALDGAGSQCPPIRHPAPE